MWINPSDIRLTKKGQNTLTAWTHFQKKPISHTACQMKPEHTHILDTFSEKASLAMQLGRRSQNTLISWTHFQRVSHQLCSLAEEARTHSSPGHIFRESLISYAAWQKKPEHTHFLHRFSERASSVMQLGRRSQNTLTYWTHFQSVMILFVTLKFLYFRSSCDAAKWPIIFVTTTCPSQWLPCFDHVHHWCP